MHADADRFFVLTGGPGSGKTTLIEALRAKGFATTAEAGRAIIRDQAAIGGPGLPWNDPALFAELMLAWELRSYRQAGEERGLVFFDRGVPDVLGYMKLTGLPAAAHVESASRRFRYNRKVFFLPPWPGIFRQDGERKQTFEEAERTYAAMIETYGGLGYEPAVVPVGTVEARLRFVLSEACS